VYFRQIIFSRLDEYNATHGKKKKGKIIDAVVEHLESRGARFLEQKESGQWEPAFATRQLLRDKIFHAFRDYKRQQLRRKERVKQTKEEGGVFGGDGEEIRKSPKIKEKPTKKAILHKHSKQRVKSKINGSKRYDETQKSPPEQGAVAILRLLKEGGGAGLHPGATASAASRNPFEDPRHSEIGESKRPMPSQQRPSYLLPEKAVQERKHVVPEAQEKRTVVPAVHKRKTTVSAMEGDRVLAPVVQKTKAAASAVPENRAVVLALPERERPPSPTSFIAQLKESARYAPGTTSTPNRSVLNRVKLPKVSPKVYAMHPYYQLHKTGMLSQIYDDSETEEEVGDNEEEEGRPDEIHSYNQRYVVVHGRAQAASSAMPPFPTQSLPDSIRKVPGLSAPNKHVPGSPHQLPPPQLRRQRQSPPQPLPRQQPSSSHLHPQQPLSPPALHQLRKFPSLPQQSFPPPMDEPNSDAKKQPRYKFDESNMAFDRILMQRVTQAVNHQNVHGVPPPPPPHPLLLQRQLMQPGIVGRDGHVFPSERENMLAAELQQEQLLSQALFPRLVGPSGRLAQEQLVRPPPGALGVGSLLSRAPKPVTAPNTSLTIQGLLSGSGSFPPNFSRNGVAPPPSFGFGRHPPNIM
jgi:hypothetical protein